ncbi:MAG: hypothetical protein IT438_04535 [Phycisphaerales bacterium]|nr:hypothetical protein [Phycisphaerales bacterium]
MLRVSPKNAAPGMVIALPVFHPQKPGHVLLKPGGVLDADIITALLELHVHTLWIEYPPTSFMLRHISPAVLAEHGRLAIALGDEFDRVRRDVHADLDFGVFCPAVRSLVHRLVDDDGASVFIDAIVAAGDPLLTHGANVGMLSLLMGLKLDGYLVEQRARVSPRRAQNVENLGIGAVLSDVGMLHIDTAAASRWWSSYNEADPAWRRHVLLGFERVRGHIPATAAGVVLHHHQRMDGSGFPRKSIVQGSPRAPRGQDIHIFSRIVAVADEFCRARARAGVDQPIAPSVVGLRRVVDLTRAGKLDANVLRALAAVVPAYMPGSTVELNNGRVCVVTGWDPTRPCSPEVRPLIGHDPGTREHVLGAPINLAQQPALSIVRSDGEPVANTNFHPERFGEFDLRAAQSASLELDAA